MNSDEPDPPNADGGASRAIETGEFDWPTATLDSVAKMRVLAAGLPHCAVDERLIAADFDPTWRFIADLEGNTPRYEGTVSRLRILEREHDRLKIEARSLPGIWSRWDVVLRTGWCVMHSHLGQVGFAARPEGEGRTRVIHFEGSLWLGRIARPFFRRNIRGDLDRIARFVA